MYKQFRTFVAFGAFAAIAFVLSACSDTTTNTPDSLYSVTYHAAAPVNKDYSKSLVETDTVSFYDSVAHRTVRAWRLVGWGRCSCGAVTDQFYLTCDSLGKVVSVPSDSGSCGIKVLGEESELYARGNAQIDSFQRGVDKITVNFHGYVMYMGDTVQLTGGVCVAPSPK